MGYKRKIFSDKTILVAASVGVITISAIVGATLLDTSNDLNGDTPPIVDLSKNDESTKANNENVTKEMKDEGMAVANDEDVNAILPTKGGTEGESQKNNTDVSQETKLDKQEDEKQTQKQDDKAVSGIAGLKFNQSSKILWPVEGDVLIDFDMDNTVYFPTLDLYKCSDAVCVQAEAGTPVYAGCPCKVDEISYNTEIGNNVTVSMGDGYLLTYGQLKDVQVEKDSYLEEGDLIGYVGSPTKYYSVEGENLYMKMTHNGEPIDPLDYLNY